MKVNLEVEATDGAARTGSMTLSRGAVETPVFMPVGTRGTVRALRTADVEALGAQIILGNTYHLMLKPGGDVVEALGGLHKMEDWDRHMLTDSGGYQVFSLSPKVTEEGARFRSTYDGSSHLLTPEGAVEIQQQLGADIQMVLDVCSALPAPRSELQAAVERTARWAERAKRTHTRTDDQALFGICQGGTDPVLRKESAQRTVEIGFDGYAIGGLSVGEGSEEMAPALEAALQELPVDQPRYFMGLGDPVGMIEAVMAGVDMMDCVLPTRLARHGTLLTSAGRMNIKRAEFATSTDPIDPECSCETCRRYSRGYLRHLAVVSEPTAATLFTIHNLAWTFGFMDEIRAAIRSQTISALHSKTIETWGSRVHSS